MPHTCNFTVLHSNSERKKYRKASSYLDLEKWATGKNFDCQPILTAPCGFFRSRI